MFVVCTLWSAKSSKKSPEFFITQRPAQPGLPWHSRSASRAYHATRPRGLRPAAFWPCVARHAGDFFRQPRLQGHKQVSNADDGECLPQARPLMPSGLASNYLVMVVQGLAEACIPQNPPGFSHSAGTSFFAPILDKSTCSCVSTLGQRFNSFNGTLASASHRTHPHGPANEVSFCSRFPCQHRSRKHILFILQYECIVYTLLGMFAAMAACWATSGLPLP